MISHKGPFDFFPFLICYEMNLECHGVPTAARQMWELTTKGLLVKALCKVSSCAVIHAVSVVPILSISVELSTLHPAATRGHDESCIFSINLSCTVLASCVRVCPENRELSKGIAMETWFLFWWLCQRHWERIECPWCWGLEGSLLTVKECACGVLRFEASTAHSQLLSPNTFTLLKGDLLNENYKKGEGTLKMCKSLPKLTLLPYRKLKFVPK